MKKIRPVFVLGAILLIVLLAPFTLAHEAEVPHEEPGEASSTTPVTLEDLGVTKTGLLPTNPFYFVKEWERKARIFLTSNPLKKAELELEFINEKAAELKRVAENTEDGEALNRAIENYNEGIDRLRGRLEKLQSSSNPNIEDLLNRLEEKTAKHQQLFEELKSKNETAREKLEQIQIKISEKLRPPAPPELD